MKAPTFYCHRASKVALIYLVSQAVMLGLFWDMALVGHNPLSFDVTHIVTGSGQPTSLLKVGSVIGVHRDICSTDQIGVKFFPSLRDAKGQQFTLPPGVYDLDKGCTEKAYGFVVPDIPAGEYTYICAIQFQSSMVGRDDTVMAPPVKVRIIK